MSYYDTRLYKDKLRIARALHYVRHKKMQARSDVKARKFKYVYYNIVYFTLCFSVLLGILFFIMHLTAVRPNYRCVILFSSIAIAMAIFSLILYAIKTWHEIYVIYCSNLAKREEKALLSDNDLSPDMIQEHRTIYERANILFAEKKGNISILRQSLSISKYVISLFVVMCTEALLLAGRTKTYTLIILFMTLEALLFLIDCIKLGIDLFGFFRTYIKLRESFKKLSKHGNAIAIKKLNSDRYLFYTTFIKKNILFAIKVISFSMSFAVAVMILCHMKDIVIHTTRIKYIKFAILITIFIFITIVQSFILEWLANNSFQDSEKKAMFYSDLEKCLEKEVDACDEDQNLSDSVLKNDTEYQHSYDNVISLAYSEGIISVLYDISVDDNLSCENDGIMKTLLDSCDLQKCTEQENILIMGDGK